jgi:hypothetical protein
MYLARVPNPNFNVTNDTTDIVPAILTELKLINVCPHTHYYDGNKCI